jgi:hypothetical protein
MAVPIDLPNNEAADETNRLRINDRPDSIPGSSPVRSEKKLLGSPLPGAPDLTTTGAGPSDVTASRPDPPGALTFSEEVKRRRKLMALRSPYRYV